MGDDHTSEMREINEESSGGDESKKEDMWEKERNAKERFKWGEKWGVIGKWEERTRGEKGDRERKGETVKEKLDWGKN